MSRLMDIKKFYRILSKLEKKNGGKLLFDDCISLNGLPDTGVYFIFEKGEIRSTSGDGLRVVRVGSHALMPYSKSTLYNRLRSLRGNDNDWGGKHRRSIFRRHIGRAIISRNKISCPSWDKRIPPGPRENLVEEKVSRYIRKRCWFLYLAIDQALDSWKVRRLVARNSIALLGNCSGAKIIDPPSRRWLGLAYPPNINSEIPESGLWNIQHVRKEYNPDFLDVLYTLVNGM